MDKPSAIRLLAGAHAVAIVLDDDGYDHETIGRRLGVHPDAVEPLLRVARAKLVSLQDLEEDPALPCPRNR